jgi:hypothetical protein
MTPEELEQARIEAQRLVKEKAMSGGNGETNYLNPAAPEVTRRNATAILRVFAISRDGKITQGTGFRVKSDKPMILTGSKLTHGAEVIFLESYGKTYAMSSWASNPAIGLTAIPIAGLMTGELIALELASEADLAKNPIESGKAFTTGFPLEEEIEIKEGMIWGMDATTGELSVGGELSLGVIGGPIADAKGRIVGVFTGYNPEDQTINKGATAKAMALHKDWKKFKTKLAPNIVEELETLVETTPQPEVSKRIDAAGEALGAFLRPKRTTR